MRGLVLDREQAGRGPALLIGAVRHRTLSSEDQLSSDGWEEPLSPAQALIESKRSTGIEFENSLQLATVCHTQPWLV